MSILCEDNDARDGDQIFAADALTDGDGTLLPTIPLHGLESKCGMTLDKGNSQLGTCVVLVEVKNGSVL